MDQIPKLIHGQRIRPRMFHHVTIRAEGNQFIDRINLMVFSGSPISLINSRNLVLQVPFLKFPQNQNRWFEGWNSFGGHNRIRENLES